MWLSDYKELRWSEVFSGYLKFWKFGHILCMRHETGNDNITSKQNKRWTKREKKSDNISVTIMFYREWFNVFGQCIGAWWCVQKHYAAGQVPTLTAPLTREALLKLTCLLLMAKFLIQPT